MASKTKIALIIEYDGTRYHGFQLQPNAPTVQGAVEAALQKLVGEAARIIPASRTDAGVHAAGQVISFRTGSLLPLVAYVHGLNHYLPGDVAVKAAYRVKDSFDVRRHATSREYRYCILNSATRSPTKRGFSYLVPGHLDIEAMNQACQVLIGEHDFASFATRMEGRKRDTVKNVYRASVQRNGDLVIFNIVANSYLPHQVRNTVGSLIRVGLVAITVSDFRDILEARKPGTAGPTVPAQGLCLMRVNYAGPLGEDKWEELE